MRGSNRVKRAITCALQDMLVDNRGANGNRSHYGILVPSFSRDLRHIDLAFGFLADHRYCCDLIGCHVSYHSSGWWRELRKLVARQGVDLPRSMITIHAAVFTEPDARFSTAQWPAAVLRVYESIWSELEGRL